MECFVVTEFLLTSCRVSGHPLAAGRAQDRESTSAKDRRSTIEPTPPTPQERYCAVSFDVLSHKILAPRGTVRHSTVRRHVYSHFPAPVLCGGRAAVCHAAPDPV